MIWASQPSGNPCRRGGQKNDSVIRGRRLSVPPSLSCAPAVGGAGQRFGRAKPSGMASFGHGAAGWRWPSFGAPKGSCPQPSRGFLGGPAPRCPSAGYPAAWPVEGGLIGRPRVAARIWPSAMIKTQIGADRSPGLGNRVGGSERDLLVCARPPKPLGKDLAKDIVTPTPGSAMTPPCCLIMKRMGLRGDRRKRT